MKPRRTYLWSITTTHPSTTPYHTWLIAEKHLNGIKWRPTLRSAIKYAKKIATLSGHPIDITKYRLNSRARQKYITAYYTINPP